MEEPKKENENIKSPEKHSRITLLSFFYFLCVISILSLVCLIYSLHLKDAKNLKFKVLII